jgi:hypothetical protein
MILRACPSITSNSVRPTERRTQKQADRNLDVILGQALSHPRNRNGSVRYVTRQAQSADGGAGRSLRWAVRLHALSRLPAPRLVQEARQAVPDRHPRLHGGNGVGRHGRGRDQRNVGPAHDDGRLGVDHDSTGSEPAGEGQGRQVPEVADRREPRHRDGRRFGPRAAKGCKSRASKK